MSSFLQKCFLLIDDHFQNKDPRFKLFDPDKLKENFELDLGVAHQEEKLLELLKDWLKYSVPTHGIGFNNQLYGGLNTYGLVGEFFSTLTNTSMSTYEISPLATLMEKTLVEKMNQLVGYTNGEGIMVTGGSNANMLAILSARNTLYPETKAKGNTRKFVVFTSDQAHYSFLKGANILGIGTDQVWKVKSDQNARMIPSELDQSIKKSKALGLTPLFVGATSGTTVFGAFDPLREISEICQKHNLWFHIDGAYGGSTLLSPQKRELLNGSELSDSFAWDAHKMMNVPLIASFYLCKKRGTLHQSHAGGGDTYLFHQKGGEDYDTGRLSIQCGRKIDSLKVWLMWKAMGDEKLAQKINHDFEMAAYLGKKIKDHPRTKLIKPVSSINVCFQVIGDNVQDQSQFNLELREKLIREGRFFVNHAKEDGESFIRMVCINPGLTAEVIDQLFDDLIRLAT